MSKVGLLCVTGVTESNVRECSTMQKLESRCFGFALPTRNQGEHVSVMGGGCRSTCLECRKHKFR